MEIFYNAEEHVVAQDLGNNTRQYMMGWSGLLGPVGMLAALAVTHVASQAALDQISVRSGEFNLAAKYQAQGQDMNREFAQHVAQRLQASGKVVKLSEVPRLPGARPGMTPGESAGMPAGGPTGASGGASRDLPGTAPKPGNVALADSGYTPTPGFSPLLLRITTGYGAPESYADYKPFALVEYALVHPGTSQYLLDGKLRATAAATAASYSDWVQLRAEAGPARTHLRDSLLSVGNALLAEVDAPAP